MFESSYVLCTSCRRPLTTRSAFWLHITRPTRTPYCWRCARHSTEASAAIAQARATIRQAQNQIGGVA